MKPIGRYIIRGLLGRGGMGKVYKVELPPIGKIAALKLFDPDPLLEKLLGRKQLRDQFASEAATLAGLKHPHIVEIHDFDIWEDRPFYVMDYYAHNLGALMGESFQTEKLTRILPADRALAYSRQILEGLVCLHDSGIIHRDVKPFNLLITAYDALKVCDFGLSKLHGDRYTGPSHLNVGSPYYAAPEQEKDPNQADQTADIYPVGVMLYRMLTGRLPEISADRPTYPPASRFNSDLDSVWDDFIGQAVAFHPAERFPTAGDMLLALDELRLHWQAQKEQACAWSTLDGSSLAPTTATGRKRAVPLKMAPAEVSRRAGLDALWRPIQYSANDFHRTESRILDKSTHLIWQEAGSNHPCTWSQAEVYVTDLNARRFGGIDTWRLPTIEELITLLRPAPRAGDLCLPPLFDDHQRLIWSADRRSYTAAYYVDAELGFVGWQDFDAHHFVRAVSSE